MSPFARLVTAVCSLQRLENFVATKKADGDKNRQYTSTPRDEREQRCKRPGGNCEHLPPDEHRHHSDRIRKCKAPGGTCAHLGPHHHIHTSAQERKRIPHAKGQDRVHPRRREERESPIIRRKNRSDDPRDASDEELLPRDSVSQRSSPRRPSPDGDRDEPDRGVHWGNITDKNPHRVRPNKGRQRERSISPESEPRQNPFDDETVQNTQKNRFAHRDPPPKEERERSMDGPPEAGSLDEGREDFSHQRMRDEHGDDSKDMHSRGSESHPASDPRARGRSSEEEYPEDEYEEVRRSEDTTRANLGVDEAAEPYMSGAQGAKKGKQGNGQKADQGEMPAPQNWGSGSR
ncbi:uncharacterized protein KY384_003051 [Bacidia gigantensis]|uniref:uncharacterized protein n=1 Tax=Bacidia gigantensis TaxID=2732470 RepID=UPI001D05B0FE|nr:uncharacterized protein KY384_003051 [Bacidia gigantensis]KAG8531422.1 hypothetical protein KY384_003051 [Bacidia gigantensis]